MNKKARGDGCLLNFLVIRQTSTSVNTAPPASLRSAQNRFAASGVPRTLYGICPHERAEITARILPRRYLPLS